jgi:lipopolysaccharide transport system ATP-binding protein
MSDSNAIRLEGIGKCYRIYNRPEDRLKQMLVRGRCTYFREFNALNNINLTVTKGQTVGLVGSNGSGKSTLLQIVCGTLAPTSGNLSVNGRISALLELGAGFNPEFSGRENIYLNAAILGLTREQTDEKYDSIVAFSGLDRHHLNQPVKTYSSGMYVRLAFAVAVAVEPDILVVDEALAVGDEAFQRKCFARIEDLKASGTTILFVSHAAQTIIELCDHAVLMDAGEILCQGEPKDIITGYHRLIFAAHDKRAAIRRDLQQGKISATNDTPAATLDEGLRSESAIEYERHGGAISGIRLSDLSGKTVNILQSGGRYRFCYRVDYSDAAHKPKYGMLIKTKRGVELGGAVAIELAEKGQDKAAGTHTDVAFEFTCCLRPGHYFINCGATKRERDEDIFVHRIVDALQFKVEEAKATPHIEPAGNVDMQIRCALTA